MIDDYHYAILIFWSEEDQAYLVELPDWVGRVPGPVTHGDTYEQAFHNGLEVIEGLIESARKHNEPLPEVQARAVA